MNPTVDGMMAAMGWDRVAAEANAVMYEFTRADARALWPREYLAPRWRVPAIRRRQAARRHNG